MLMKEPPSQSSPVMTGDLPAGAHLCSCKQAAEGGIVIPQIQPQGCSPLDTMPSVTQTKCPGRPSAPEYILTECIFQMHSWYQPFMLLIFQASR